LIALVSVLAITGYFLFAQFADYTYMSDRHIDDILRAKLWSLSLILIFGTIIYWKRRSPIAPALAVFGLSLYFILIYAILLRGTQYGINGHWGDNGYRLAVIRKMMAYNYLADACTKKLTGMYPPLWFYMMALYAKALGLEAWQTLKFGYLVVFILYPWSLYFFWKPLVSSRGAALITVATLFFAHKYLDYIYYEHITAALFIPWWLYFFENVPRSEHINKRGWRHYVVGIITGGLLFMTYHYWFFLAVISLPLTLMVRFGENRSWRLLLLNLRHKAIIGAGIAVISSPYWLPNLIMAFKTGIYSSQVTWFSLSHANLTSHWVSRSLDGAMVLAGIFFVGYFWNRWNRAHLALLYAGGLILIIMDRALNLGGHSIQTRKILEFTHVFAFAPLALGIEEIWVKLKEHNNSRMGLLALGLVLVLVFANEHTEIYQSDTYKTGLNQRVPVNDLAVFASVDCYNKVFLTNKYIEACYYPYFVFIGVSDVSAHFAARYGERVAFLRTASTVSKPDLFAYLLTYNRFDKIDYIYLPYKAQSRSYEFVANMVSFNSRVILDTLRFPGDIIREGNYFHKRHDRNLFEIIPPPRSTIIDSIIRDDYPDAFQYLQPYDPNPPGN
jgi:galactan 5-O-arabinofuranosyltransferase